MKSFFTIKFTNISNICIHLCSQFGSIVFFRLRFQIQFADPGILKFFVIFRKWVLIFFLSKYLFSGQYIFISFYFSYILFLSCFCKKTSKQLSEHTLSSFLWQMYSVPFQHFKPAKTSAKNPHLQKTGKEKSTAVNFSGSFL